MKRLLFLLAVFVFVLGGCSSDSEYEISELNVAFVPSAPAEKIEKATAPLEQMIKDEMGKLGYTIEKVNITVGASYEAVGQSLAAGTTDIGFIPGGTYVLFEEQGVEVILTATRSGLSKDFENAKDWNDQKATLEIGEQVEFYRALILSGPSEYGVKLSDKINAGEELTFEDIDGANVCVQSASSSSGYLYPNLLLHENHDKDISDLSNVISVNGYGDALGKLATGQCDITPIYSDARIDYEENWTSTYGREKTVWEETNVIGVSTKIYNDTISISNDSPVYSEQFVKDFQTIMSVISKTTEGLEVISIYSHEGYVDGVSSNYDKEREVLELTKSNE